MASGLGWWRGSAGLSEACFQGWCMCINRGRILLTLVPGPEVPASSREFGTAVFASHRRAPESLRGAIPSGCDLADSLGDFDLFSIIPFREAGQPCP